MLLPYGILIGLVNCMVLYMSNEYPGGTGVGLFEFNVDFIHTGKTVSVYLLKFVLSLFTEYLL